MPYFEFKTKAIYYKTFGKGIPIIFVHAFGLDQSAYQSFFSDLKRDFKLVYFDLPGVGRSMPLDKYNMSELADLIETLRAHLDLDCFHLIGHSIGGYIGLQYLKSYPNQLASLTLLNSYCGADHEEKKINRQKSIDFVLKNGVKLYVNELVPNLFPKSFAKANPDIIQALIRKAEKFSQEGIAGLIKAMKDRKDQSNVLRKSKIKVNFILGGMDQVIPEELSIEQASYPKQSEVFILKKMGHMAPIEDPSAVSSLVVHLLQSK